MTVNRFYNLEAETEVLGAVIKENNNLLTLNDFLSYEDFYSTKHQIIYKTMMRMYENGVPIDMTTLCNELGSSLSEAGGISYISGVFSSCISASRAVYYGEIVKEKSNRRRLLRAVRESLQETKGKDTDITSIIEVFQNKLLHIKFNKSREDGSLEVPIEDFLNKLEERWKNGGDVGGIKCGYKILDRLLGGLMPQDFLIIAARPSMGKTAVAMNLALNLALKLKQERPFLTLKWASLRF